jgi:hypothetical protein
MGHLVKVGKTNPIQTQIKPISTIKLHRFQAKKPKKDTYKAFLERNFKIFENILAL